MSHNKTEMYNYNVSDIAIEGRIGDDQLCSRKSIWTVLNLKIILLLFPFTFPLPQNGYSSLFPIHRGRELNQLRLN
ncbi:hypothetical protein DYD21_16505 [Rhodohalobacter sp. SW132]|nr:hypothetical protein DYD21_16505 [Rhodohalobacter sp. SW132]